MTVRKLIYSTLIYFFVLLSSIIAGETINLDASGSLPRSTPEAEGVSSEVIADVIDTLDREINTMNSFMLVRHGKVISECWWTPHNPQSLHAFYSLSKSFTSTAIGLAVAEGKLSLDDPVIKFFPNDLPEKVSDNLKKMKVRHILSMSGGHKTEPSVSWMHPALEYDEEVKSNPQTWVRTFLAHPVECEPGTFFRYNTCGTFMLSAILKKVTGEDLFDYLQPRLFDPLKIKGVYWERNPQGISKGGTGFHAKTEDIAKFGQLYLQKGKWNGRQILTSDWVAEATTKQVENPGSPNPDWSQGYCFQFWRCRHNIYRGDGAYVQFCIVMPEQDAVVAITSDSSQYQQELDILWSKLLPAFGSKPLPANSKAQARLKAAQTGRKAKLGVSGSHVTKDKKIRSAILQKDVRYSIYLPNNYVTDDFDYPVVYLLHGLGDDNNSWLDSAKGNMKKIADEYFIKYPERKAIIVMPDAWQTWYMNSADEKCRYEDFFFKELIPTIERNYRCKKGAKYRSITGLSMGGQGALLYALRHPEMFHACYAMSPGVFIDEKIPQMSKKDFLRRFTVPMGSLADDKVRIAEYFKKNSVIDLVQSASDKTKNSVLFYIDIGDKDFLLPGVEKLHSEMKARGIEHVYEVRPGVHNWEFWRVALPKAFDFFVK